MDMTLFDTFRHVVFACDKLKLYHSFDDSHIFLKLIIKMRCFYLIEFRATRVLFHVFLILLTKFKRSFLRILSEFGYSIFSILNLISFTPGLMKFRSLRNLFFWINNLDYQFFKRNQCHFQPFKGIIQRAVLVYVSSAIKRLVFDPYHWFLSKKGRNWRRIAMSCSMTSELIA